MFKCKHCGKALGANTPARCPGCGERCRQPSPSRLGQVTGLLIFSSVVELLVIGLVAGVVVFALIRFF